MMMMTKTPFTQPNKAYLGIGLINTDLGRLIQRNALCVFTLRIIFFAPTRQNKPVAMAA